MRCIDVTRIWRVLLRFCSVCRIGWLVDLSVCVVDRRSCEVDCRFCIVAWRVWTVWACNCDVLRVSVVCVMLK